MILSDHDIKEELKAGSDDTITVNGVDLRLSEHYYVERTDILGRIWNMLTGKTVDFSKDNIERFRFVKGDYIEIPALSFAIVSTVELLQMPDNIAGICSLRSSLSRNAISKTNERSFKYIRSKIMDTNFLIAFMICLFGYIIHTMAHFLEHKGNSKLPRILEIILTIIIFMGYVGWGFMIYLDPIKMGLSDYIAKPLGLLIGLAGFALFILSAKAKKGFYELDNLVTKGIYSKIRNPMYFGVILIHIGFPLATKSFLTLISVIIWIPLILIWKYWEEKDLEKRFREKYIIYKKKTFF